MPETLALAVWCAEPTARFDTRKFHFVRRDALHAALDPLEGIRVLEWGKTGEKYQHEIVDLVVEVGRVAAPSAAVPALAYLQRLLAKNATSKAATAAVAQIIARLAPKQAAGEIALVHLHLLNNSVIRLYPAGQMAQAAILRIISPDGGITDLPYDASEAEIATLTGNVT
ncbi:MAG: hypothetical protein ABI835_20605 [Chloroflexota bacterium]